MDNDSHQGRHQTGSSAKPIQLACKHCLLQHPATFNILNLRKPNHNLSMDGEIEALLGYLVT